MNKANFIHLKEMLLSQVEKCSKNLGICDGKTGIAILSGILSKVSTDVSFNSIFQNSLDEISENIISVIETNFEAGISGIGWGIEWLSQNKILEDINTDEILADFDDLLYKEIVFQKSNKLNLLTGELGTLKYFHARNNSNNIGTHRFRKMVNRECITILEDRINEYLKLKIGITAQLTQNEIVLLGDILKIMTPRYTVLDEMDSMLRNAAELVVRILENVKIVLPSLERLSSYNIINLAYLVSNFLNMAIRLGGFRHRQLAFDITGKLNKVIDKRISTYTKEELFKLIRVRTLICYYENNENNENKLREGLVLLKMKSKTVTCLNDCKIIILAELAVENIFIPNAQELILYS